MAQDDEIRELAKERAKQKAKERLSQISGGDFTRGFGNTSKSGTLDEVIATAKRKTTTKQSTSANTTTVNANSTVQSSKEIKKETKNKKIEQNYANPGEIDIITANVSRSKERRNKVVIAMLSVSVALIWAFIIIASVIKPAEPNHNFKVYLSGDRKSQGTVLLDGKPKMDWKVEDGISVGKNYEDDISLKLTGTGEIEVDFRLEVYKDKTLIENFGTIETDQSFSQYFDSDHKEWYNARVTAPCKITILTKISFVYSSKYPEMQELNSNNIRLKLYIELN